MSKAKGSLGSDSGSSISMPCTRCGQDTPLSVLDQHYGAHGGMNLGNRDRMPTNDALMSRNTRKAVKAAKKDAGRKRAAAIGKPRPAGQ